MVNRKLVSGANSVLIGVGVVIIAILINALLSQVYWRVDLTTNKIFTLSPVSEKAVDGLEEPIEVRAFISDDLPPPYHHLERQVEELLMEYEAVSGGMLSYQIVSTDDDDEIEELAQGYGIEQVTIGQESETERSYRSVYKGVAFVQGDKVETIDDLRSSGRAELDNFEYEFTRALLNLKDREPRRIALLSGAGGPVERPQFVELLQVFFSELYGDMLQVEAVDRVELADLSDKFSALVILNIEGDLGDDALGSISDYLKNGGSVGWYQSSGIVDMEATRQAVEQMRQAGMQGSFPAPLRRPLDSDLVEFFEKMGLRFGIDAVIDRERAISYSAVPTEHGQMRVSHPAIFPIDNMAHELPFMRYFSTLVIPLPATVTVDEQVLPQGSRAYDVLRTAESATRLPEPPSLPLYEELRQPMAGEQSGVYTVAAALEMSSPEGKDGTAARVLVVGSGELLSGLPEVGYHGELAAMGIQFFLSSVEWLAQEHDLAGIRGKKMPPLVAEIPGEARRSIQILNIIVVPGLFASIGLLLFVRRRRRKRRFDELNVEVQEGDDG